MYAGGLPIRALFSVMRCSRSRTRWTGCTFV